MLLDDVGAEFTSAFVKSRGITFAERGRLVHEQPLAIRPLEVIQPSDKASRAAGGFLLLGPLGAAVGVLTSKGPGVRFELQYADDKVRQGIVAQRDYTRLRRKIEKMQVRVAASAAAVSRAATRKPPQPPSPRTTKLVFVSAGLLLLALMAMALIGPAGLLAPALPLLVKFAAVRADRRKKA